MVMNIYATKKKYSLIVAVVLLTGSGSQVAADGADCIGIENDIARLQCFDTAFASSSSPKLSVQEAIQNLIDVTSYSSDNEVMQIVTLANSCHIQANYLVNENLHPENRTVMISRNDLSTVERVGNWVPVGGTMSLQLFNKRETSGYWFQAFGVVPPNLVLADVIVREDLVGMRQSGTYSGRDAKFYLMASEYKPDAALIRDAMEAAVEACQSQ